MPQKKNLKNIKKKVSIIELPMVRGGIKQQFETSSNTADSMSVKHADSSINRKIQADDNENTIENDCFSRHHHLK